MNAIKKIISVAGIALLVCMSLSCRSAENENECEIENGNGNEVELAAPSLRVIYSPYFPMGNIVAYRHHRRHSDIAAVTTGPGVATTRAQADARGQLLRRHFDILTAEDEMKPDFIHTLNLGQFNWTRANNIMAFAEENGMRVHGHALAWHSQTPAWLFADGDREQAAANLREHINTVMRHPAFARIESWDVLNEVIASSVNSSSGTIPVTAANWREHLRGNNAGESRWFSSIGSSVVDPDNNCFIWIAFTEARRVADELDIAAGRPVGSTILYYNDYNEEQPNKREAIFFMVQEMNQKFADQNPGRRLIDAIGMQAHYHVGGTGAAYPWALTVSNVYASINRFAELDVYISITELDLTVGHTGNAQGGNITRPIGDPLTAQQARQQAVIYAQLFRIFRNFARENPGRLRRVSLWGIDDPGSWRHRGSPHLWDGNLQPKEAFWAAADPDAFLLPDGQPRPASEIDAFLADPKANGSGFIPADAWLLHLAD